MGGAGHARLPLAAAESLAAEALALLAPWCERIEIAGSIRRRKPDIGDIELVCVPSFEAGVPDLFGATGPGRNVLDAAMAALLDDGVFASRLGSDGKRAFGERYKRLTYRPHAAGGGVALDVFSVVDPAQWGVILLLRTGPAAFSKRLVTSRVLGGWLPAGTQVRDGALWAGGQAVATPEEADVFRFCALPVLAPELRTDTVRLVRAGAQWRWVDVREGVGP